MKIFLREWWVYDLVKGSLKFKTIVWNNYCFKPTFFSKEIKMKVKDLILKLQELAPEKQVVVVYDAGTVKVNGVVLTKGEEVMCLEKELSELLNKHSADNASNTPDFVLATYLFDCLEAFGKAVKWRDSLTKERNEQT